MLFRVCCADVSPPLRFQPFLFPCFTSVFQKSATKPHTYTIMTPESPGAEYTSATWNSARARPGKSSVKESATQVRFGVSVLIVVSGNFVILIKPVQKVSFLLPRRVALIRPPWLRPRLEWKDRLYDSLWLRNGVAGHTPWVWEVFSSQRGMFVGIQHSFSQRTARQWGGLCYLNRNRIFFFCHGGRSLFYPPWEKNCLF